MKKSKEKEPQTLDPKGRTPPFRRLTCFSENNTACAKRKTGPIPVLWSCSLPASQGCLDQFFRCLGFIHTARLPFRTKTFTVNSCTRIVLFDRNSLLHFFAKGMFPAPSPEASFLWFSHRCSWGETNLDDLTGQMHCCAVSLQKKQELQALSPTNSDGLEHWHSGQAQAERAESRLEEC